MVVNIGWPRAEINGAQWQHRFAPLILTSIVVLTAAIAGTFAQRRRVARVAAGRSSLETA